MLKKGFNLYFVYVILAATMWGMAGLFVRTANNFGIFEMQLVFGRAIFTSLVLVVVIFLKDKTLFKVKPKDLWLFASSGLFSIVLFNFSYYKTMSLTSLSVAAVLLYTAPFFVMLFSCFLFSKRITLPKCVAALMAFLGCCFVTGLFETGGGVGAKAVFFGLLTGFGYSLYTVFGELLIKRSYSTLTITFYVFLFAALFSVMFINVGDTAVAFFATPKAFSVVFLMAIFNTVIPYILYTKGLLGVDPSVAPIIATIEPVVATIVGAVFFKEIISVSTVIGVLFVLISIALLNKGKLSVTANAKINLSLAVTGKREDGYHLIDTVMQSVTLGDKITLSKAKSIRLKCNLVGVKQEDNIAFKAAKLFLETAGISGGVKIVIKKRIPAAGGLGGGSADAAAVILGLDRLYKTELTYEKLCEMAVKLGADVPFFIKGGTQRATGIGEILTEIPPFKSGYFLLCKGGTKPSTAEMYKKLDSEIHDVPDIEATVNALASGDNILLAKSLENSFAAVWKQSEIKDKLLSLDPLAVSLSGSGPVWFSFYTDNKKAKSAYKTLKKQKAECYLVKPCNKAIIFE